MAIKILWADDEIDLLKPHVLFLQGKGYEVTTVNSGLDAIEEVQKARFDVIFLDENMPGLSGLETLSRIKEAMNDVPVVMITKSEEEYIMEEAIGSKIADYLIKPVNPNQILLSIKKIVDNKRLVSEKTAQGYQQDFRNISMAFMDDLDFEAWKGVYRKLVYWDLELSTSKDSGMSEVLDAQKTEANHNWSSFIRKNYLDFINNRDPKAPLMSHELMRHKILPHVDGKEPVIFLLIDNLRYDQWKVIQPVLSEYFTMEEEDIYMSILPTTTQYCRNAIFSGLLPSEIEKRFPKMWSNDEDEGGKNNFEEDFLADQLNRLRKGTKFSYTKITNLDGGKNLVDQIPNLLNNDLSVVVYNFVDALSHARTDVSLMRELSEDEAAYRSVTLSWFIHSPLFEALKRISNKKFKLIISTDHGSVRVKDPVKIVGDKNTNTNLRYKQGKNLSYERKEVFEIKNPAEGFLPRLHVSSAYVFADNYNFFAYPNNYNYYVKYYRDTFQHGGISMEEMMIPIISLKGKG
ncbi:MAG: PglZ domain-containing protein [Bacteroidota bacterium]|nr:PglZ domain-containing protein [Bacteroidota bacterium]MDX5430472.1 PglZ domain-containing protein [Bacteroidota bacterium]MDX5469233.1 PglZ domain-containing protein [Bacteroidota bacterium]